MKYKISIGFLFTIILLGCSNSSTRDNNYIDTWEELEESAPYLNQRRNEINLLPKDQFMDSLTTHGCKVLARMNLDLFQDDVETIVQGFSSKDSTDYKVLIDLFRPVAYLFVGDKKRRFNKAEQMELNTLMNQKCPDLFSKYQVMEKKELQVLIKGGPSLFAR